MKKIDWLQIVVQSRNIYISNKESGHHALAHHLGRPFIELTNKKNKACRPSWVNINVNLC